MEPPPPPLQLLSLSSSSSSSPSSSSPSPSPSSSSLSSSSSSVSSSQLLPFACRLCSLSFAKSHSLAEHVMCRHSTTKEEEEEENEDKDSSSSSPPPSSFSSSSASTSSAAASSASNSSSHSSSSPVSSSSAKRSFKCARCEVVAATKSDLHRHENDSHRLQQTERFLWAMYSEQQSQQSTNNNSRVMPDDNVEGGEEFVEELLTEEKSPNRVLDPFLLSTAYRCSLCGQAFTYRCRWHLVHRDELPNDDDADDDNSLKVNKKGPAETTQLPFPCFFCIKKIFEAKKRRQAERKRQLRNSKTNSEQPVIELDEDEEEMEAEEMEIAGDNEPISRADHPLGQNSEIPKGDNKKDDNQNNRTASVPNRTSATTPPLTITAKLTYKCAGCRLRFTSREDRADHEAAEGHRPSKFACSICGRVLRDRYKLDRHRATVHADLPQHLLQMSFGDSKSANSEHLGPIRTPSAVGAFQCPLCRKRLSRKDHLKEHLRKRHSWRGAISNSAISLAAAKAAERKTVQEESKEDLKKMEVNDNYLGDKEETKATTDQNSETNHHVHLRLEIEANGFISSSTNKFSSSASSSSSSSSSSGVSSGNSSCNCSPTIIY